MLARVFITLKPGVFDPQGRATEGALAGLGFADVKDVRHGKMIEIELEACDRETGLAHVDAMCRRLLVNTVTEAYRIEMA